MSEVGSIEREQPKIERRGDVVTINKPEGVYSIAYGIHLVEKKQEVPSGVDGICFEWPSKYPSSNDEVQRVAAVANQKPLFDYAERNRLPLLAVDCSITPVALAEELVGPLEFIMAGYLFGRMRERVAQKGMTRRKFLKTMLVGGAALYLTLPYVSLFGRLGSSSTGVGEEQTAELSKLTQRIHPEYKILILGLRDTVAAQKMQFLLQNRNYKHLLAPRGTEHVGIEDAILAQESERIDFLSRLRPVLPKVVSDLGTFYQINEYRLLPGGNWEIAQRLEEPSLKAIIKT